jgi:hypothetical protein
VCSTKLMVQNVLKLGIHLEMYLILFATSLFISLDIL